MVKLIIKNTLFNVSDTTITNNQYLNYLHKKEPSSVNAKLFDEFEMTNDQLNSLVLFLEDHDFNRLDMNMISQIYHLPNKYICDRNDIITYLSSIKEVKSYYTTAI